jgi:chitinase
MKSATIFSGFFLLIALLFNPLCSKIAAQSVGVDKKTAVKKISGLKKDLQKVKKILSFKKNLKHHDSAKMARRFVHEQHKFIRQRGNYPYKLNKSTLLAAKRTFSLDSNFELGHEVLGWYPFWEKDLYKTINYKLLSTIAYFAYEVNPRNGEAKTIHDWKTTPVLDSAKAHKKKILLTVTNFGNADNRKLLKSQKSTATLIKNLVTLIRDRGAHGICVDFEGVKKSERNEFSAFIARLKQELLAADSNFQLYVTVPGVDWEQYLDFDTLVPFVDLFVIMGYDYYGQTSKVAGPVAPLQSGKIWEPYNLEVSVEFYLKSGVPNNKLMLALPYYGSIWETDSGKKSAKARKYVGARTYDYIKANITSRIQYDTVSKSAWSAYAVQDGEAPFRQVWFDNMTTFSIKLKYLKQKKLKGLGIWALGYNYVNKDLWKAVAVNLVKPTINNTTIPSDSDSVNPSSSSGPEDTKSNDPATADDTKNNSLNPQDSKSKEGAQKNTVLKKLTDIEGILKEVTHLKTVLMAIMLLVVVYGGIGFVIGMFQPDTRAYFFTNTAQTVYYCIVILCCLLVFFRWNHSIGDLSVVLVIGFVLGAVAGYLVFKILDKMKREKP